VVEIIFRGIVQFSREVMLLLLVKLRWVKKRLSNVLIAIECMWVVSAGVGRKPGTCSKLVGTEILKASVQFIMRSSNLRRKRTMRDLREGVLVVPEELGQQV
jgi:hypothetical protein